MNVGKGHWIFALIFFIAFIIVMVWAYSKDKKKNESYFKGSYKILFFIAGALTLIYLFVRFRYLLK